MVNDRMHQDTGPAIRAVRGRLLLGSTLVPGTVTIDHDRIAQVLRPDVHASGPVADADIIAPGFIDLQVNGGYGCDVGDDPRAIRAIAGRLPQTGVTSWLPTLITAPRPFYASALTAFDAARNAEGAVALGIHLEGPFLSPHRPGAHRLDCIEAAKPEMFDELVDGGAVRIVTLAPERSGAEQLIRRLRERGIVVSLGHSNASLEAYRAGADAGATMATHLFNAMSPFGHRTPNAIGAALLDDRLTAGLIADGIHSHASSLELAVRAKGFQGIALVTDMVSAAGMPDGTYEFNGRQVVLADGAVRLSDGTLAGSALFMDQAVRNMVRWTSTPLPQALRMASEVPARLLGLLDRGRIEVGRRADLVLLDEQMTVQGTIVGGKWAYRGGVA